MRELFRRQPKFRPGSGDHQRAQVPDDLWRKCPGCHELIYNRELDRSEQVCPRCDHHFRISARERINLMADDGSFEEWDAALHTANPLDFRVGSESYLDKAQATMDRTGVTESVVSGRLAVDARHFATVITDFSFFGASMGSVYGEKLARAADQARKLEVPLLTISSSGGARMQEGMLSLMQMAKTSAALSELAEARVPHFSLMVDPCYGGVTASYAAVADIVMAEPGAKIGLTGPRVIEQVTRQKLPDGFQTAEFLLDHGLIDRVVSRSEIRTFLPLLHDMYAGAGLNTAHRTGDIDLSPNGGRP